MDAQSILNSIGGINGVTGRTDGTGDFVLTISSGVLTASGFPNTNGFPTNSQVVGILHYNSSGVILGSYVKNYDGTKSITVNQTTGAVSVEQSKGFGMVEWGSSDIVIMYTNYPHREITFSVGLLTISGSGYNTVAVPAGAKWLLTSSDDAHTVSNANSGDGFTSYGAYFPVSLLANVYIKGTDTKTVSLLWYK